jgi:hypothetical protein
MPFHRLIMPILFSHLGFTYTTYITVKRSFLLVFSYLEKKKKGINSKFAKQGLGCAIHIKEYTIMMYLTRQIRGLIN